MRALHLLLLAVMLIAPLGRIGIAQAMAAPKGAPAAMAGHCADLPAAAAPAHHGGNHKSAPQQGDERKAVDCMIACAAMATAPTPFVAPPSAAGATPTVLSLSNPTGIRPEAEPPPPRHS